MGCENDTIPALRECEYHTENSGSAGAHLSELWQREATIVFEVTAPHEKVYVEFPSGKAEGR
jgi:hypothetical protein